MLGVASEHMGGPSALLVAREMQTQALSDPHSPPAGRITSVFQNRKPHRDGHPEEGKTPRPFLFEQLAKNIPSASLKEAAGGAQGWSACLACTGAPWKKKEKDRGHPSLSSRR